MTKPAPLILASQAAVQLGCHERTVRRACDRLGIPRVQGYCLLTPAQVRRVKQHIRPGPGNPTFGTASATSRAAAARRAQARRRKP